MPASTTSNYVKHTTGNPVQRQLIRRFHQQVVTRVSRVNPGTFLDAGCGEGFVARLLLDRFPGMELTGFDFNPEAVALARERNPEGTFLTASIFEIPFPDNSFECVGCFEVLEHQDRPHNALQELARVSREWLVLSVPHEPYFSVANAARAKNLDIRPRGSDPDHKQFWTRPGFAQFVDEVADISWIGGSFPWTICVAKVRSGIG